jgi:hypothetical protein
MRAKIMAVARDPGHAVSAVWLRSLHSRSAGPRTSVVCVPALICAAHVRAGNRAAVLQWVDTLPQALQGPLLCMVEAAARALTAVGGDVGTTADLQEDLRGVYVTAEVQEALLFPEVNGGALRGADAEERVAALSETWAAFGQLTPEEQSGIRLATGGQRTERVLSFPQGDPPGIAAWVQARAAWGMRGDTAPPPPLGVMLVQVGSQVLVQGSLRVTAAGEDGCE